MRGAECPSARGGEVLPGHVTAPAPDCPPAPVALWLPALLPAVRPLEPPDFWALLPALLPPDPACPPPAPAPTVPPEPGVAPPLSAAEPADCVASPPASFAAPTLEL
jgi:hypothetical protein